MVKLLRKFTLRDGWCGSDKIQVNEYGMRGLPCKKNYDKRILCIGCSFTFGANIALEETMPFILQYYLPQDDIINCGIPGAGIYAHLLNVEEYHQMRPDVVLIQWMAEKRNPCEVFSEDDFKELTQKEALTDVLFRPYKYRYASLACSSLQRNDVSSKPWDNTIQYLDEFIKTIHIPCFLHFNKRGRPSRKFREEEYRYIIGKYRTITYDIPNTIEFSVSESDSHPNRKRNKIVAKTLSDALGF